MLNRILVLTGAACLMAGVATAQPPQAQRQAQRPAQTQPAQTQPSQTQQPRSSEQQETIPEAQRSPFPGARQQPQMPREQSPQPGEPGEGTRGRVAPEQSVITHHTARIGGQTINYTADAATYIIRDDAGTPKATMFFVAYTKDGVDPKTRPVSFVYNGGPGSASLFTHMGFGPKRPVLSPDGHSLGAAPYSYTDNEDSFLDATDLVFIDAIGTGFSRPAPGERREQFYGIIEDANWFADFIYEWVTRNGRWASPKFLLGESYGTTRSAELAGVIQERHQMYLNGVALISAVAFANWGADDRSIYFLPTFITSAWYHKLLPPDLQSLPIEQVAQRAREFAHGEYAQALDKGDQLPKPEYDKVVQDLARFTGLKPQYIMNTNLRISPQRWFKELLRDKRQTVGRLDSRFIGYDVDAAGERDEYDPSEASYEGVWVAAFHDYIQKELNWKGDQYLYVSGNVRPWDQTGNTQVAEVLRSAMTQQTHLKLLVVCGYYDLATPFNGIEHTVAHMNLEPQFRKNVTFTYYEAGHMMYIDEKSHHKLHHDIDEWINSSYQH